MVLFGFSVGGSKVEARADRRPHPVPGVHGARGPVRPQPAPAADRRPGAGLPGAHRPAHRRPSLGHRRGRHAGGGADAARPGRPPAPKTGAGRAGPGRGPSLKFTAWPLVVLALWAAPDLRLHRALGRYLVGAAAVIVPVVLPVALPQPVGLRRQRHPLPARPGRGVVPGGQRPARPHAGVRLPRGPPAYVVVAGRGGPAVLVRYLWRNRPATRPRWPPSPGGSC